MSKVKASGNTFSVGGKQYTKFDCLLVYNAQCDKYGIEAEKDIHKKTAKEIFMLNKEMYEKYGVS